MILRAPALVRRSGMMRGIAGKALLAVAVAALLYQAVSILLAVAAGKLAIVGQMSTWWALSLAALVYLSSHILRILRLTLLVGGWRVGFRTLSSFHFMTAAVSLTAPLKLGEVYRVVELSNLAGGFVRAIVVVWWERTFDAAAILLLIAMAFLFGFRAPETYAVAVLAAGFIAATIIVVIVAPENLHRIAMLIIRRYDSPSTVRILQVVDALRSAIEEAPRVVRSKVASLATLTGLIWAFEAACFAILFPKLSGSLEGALGALLAFLSAVTRGETLLANLRSAADPGVGGVLLSYLAATQIPLALFGLLAAVHYVRYRMRH